MLDPKPQLGDALRETRGDLNARWKWVLYKIARAEAEGRISKEKADELRGMLR